MQTSLTPPSDHRMFKGIMLSKATNCLNPGLFPNPDLIWYMEHLKAGDEIKWLVPTGASNRSFAKIDQMRLKLEVDRFLKQCPIDYEFAYKLPLFSKYRDYYASMCEGEYEEYLSTFEWHQKRIEILTKKKFCCEHCSVEGTVTFYNGIHESQRLTFTITRFYSEHTEEIKKAIKYFRSFNLPLLNGLDILKWKVDKRVVLQLHHQYYILNRKPWDYPDDCFKVLCEPCHKKVHKEELIPCYEEFCLNEISYAVKLIYCNRCNGNGFIEKYEHVQNGICFNCWGDGYIPDSR